MASSNICFKRNKKFIYFQINIELMVRSFQFSDKFIVFVSTSRFKKYLKLYLDPYIQNMLSKMALQFQFFIFFRMLIYSLNFKIIGHILSTHRDVGSCHTEYFDQKLIIF
jgi:hypothetical protein